MDLFSFSLCAGTTWVAFQITLPYPTPYGSSWLIRTWQLKKVLSRKRYFTNGHFASGAAQDSSENIYAQIHTDGTIGFFAGATGSNTLLSQGGSSLFNQGGISYVDANGVAHVLILGGDDVRTPETKQANVLFY